MAKIEGFAYKTFKHLKKLASVVIVISSNQVRRANNDEPVKNLVAEGLPLGGLWYSGYLDVRRADTF